MKHEAVANCRVAQTLIVAMIIVVEWRVANIDSIQVELWCGVIAFVISQMWCGKATARIASQLKIVVASTIMAAGPAGLSAGPQFVETTWEGMSYKIALPSDLQEQNAYLQQMVAAKGSSSRRA